MRAPSPGHTLRAALELEERALRWVSRLQSLGSKPSHTQLLGESPSHVTSLQAVLCAAFCQVRSLLAGSPSCAAERPLSCPSRVAASARSAEIPAPADRTRHPAFACAGPPAWNVLYPPPPAPTVSRPVSIPFPVRLRNPFPAGTGSQKHPLPSSDVALATRQLPSLEGSEGILHKRSESS